MIRLWSSTTFVFCDRNQVSGGCHSKVTKAALRCQTGLRSHQCSRPRCEIPWVTVRRLLRRSFLCRGNCTCMNNCMGSRPCSCTRRADGLVWKMVAERSPWAAAGFWTALTGTLIQDIMWERNMWQEWNAELGGWKNGRKEQWDRKEGFCATVPVVGKVRPCRNVCGDGLCECSCCTSAFKWSRSYVRRLFRLSLVVRPEAWRSNDYFQLTLAWLKCGAARPQGSTHQSLGLGRV